MAEHHPSTTKQPFEGSESDSRRRISDNPQPLDYVTEELVREIIESQSRKPSTQKSFIQKLLKLN